MWPPEVAQGSLSVVDCTWLIHWPGHGPQWGRSLTYSPGLANHPAILLLVSNRQLVSMAPFSWLSIMTVTPHYKDIMRFHSRLCWVVMADGWSNLSLYLSLPVFVCVSVFVCLCTCVCSCVLLSHSEANYIRGGARLCGRAALHVWQAVSANLHCLRVALANHHLAMATVSLRPYA